MTAYDWTALTGQQIVDLFSRMDPGYSFTPEQVIEIIKHGTFRHFGCDPADSTYQTVYVTDTGADT